MAYGVNIKDDVRNKKKSIRTNARVGSLEGRTSYKHQELKNMVEGGMTNDEIIWVDSWDNY